MASRSYFATKAPKTNPVTFGLIALSCIGFLLCWFPDTGEPFAANLAFHYDLSKVWQLLTYPFVDFGLGIGLCFYIFLMLWTYSFGGMFERTYSSKSLAAHFLLSAAGFALLAFAASTLLNYKPGPLHSFWLPISFITVTMCGTFPDQQITFYSIPIKLKHLAIFEGIVVILNSGYGSPMFGVILASPLLLAWFYGQGKLGAFQPGKSLLFKRAASVKENREFDEFRSKVRDKEKDRAEKERLRKLFEGSLDDQDPPRPER